MADATRPVSPIPAASTVIHARSPACWIVLGIVVLTATSFATLGLEWYQINPHYALAIHGGIRNYDAGLGRERSSETPLAWVSAVALRYAF